MNEKLYTRLDVHFDTYYGESFYHPMMQGVVDELVEKGLAVEDDGAKVASSPRLRICRVTSIPFISGRRQSMI